MKGPASCFLTGESGELGGMARRQSSPWPGTGISNPSPSSDESYKPDRPDSLKTVGPLARNRKFESISLQGRVECEPDLAPWNRSPRPVPWPVFRWHALDPADVW